MSRVTINPDEIINWFDGQDLQDKLEVQKLSIEVEKVYGNYSKLQIHIFENLMLHEGLTRGKEKNEPNISNSN